MSSYHNQMPSLQNPSLQKTSLQTQFLSVVCHLYSLICGVLQQNKPSLPYDRLPSDTPDDSDVKRQMQKEVLHNNYL
jgi:hypothetical protein